MPNSRTLIGLIFLSHLSIQATAQTPAAAGLAPKTTTIQYGSNPAASGNFVHDGIRFYYETYGKGQPVLLIHGNNGNISEMSAQIEYFRQHYWVIAMDSRDQGRSGDSEGTITYEKMADDLNALLQHLHAPAADIIGWSDGGVEALLLAMRHPERVNKIAAMGANLSPQDVVPEMFDMIRANAAAAKPDEKNTPQGKKKQRLNQLVLTQPQIAPKSLEAVKVPTLVLAGDHDLLTDESTLSIFHHLPNGELCIFPNATHMVPVDDPALFNTTVDRFFKTPFVNKDRIKDFLKSYKTLRGTDKR